MVDLLVPSPVKFCMFLICMNGFSGPSDMLKSKHLFRGLQTIALWLVHSVAVISCSCLKSGTFLLITINLDLLCHEQLISISGSKTSSIIKHLLTKYNPILMNL